MLFEESFLSVNGRDEVQYWIYVPAAKPRGIIQLIHGFGEHSRRYLHMIQKFLDADFIVAADDHVGHGKTAIVNNSWGDWGNAGFETMVKDEKRLHDIVAEKYPNLPYLMFGHSLGSIIAKQYIARYGSDLKAATLCGTTGCLPTEEGYKFISKLVEEGHGEESDPNAAISLLGWMGERCGEIKYGNEWICHDPFVQIDHAMDPFDAFTKPTNNRAMLYFIEMAQDVCGKEWAEKVPKDLPIYSIAGDQDPVGLYGTGVYECSNWLIDTGHCVKTKLYSGYRHEIHNYKDIRDEVESGIIEFFNSKL